MFLFFSIPPFLLSNFAPILLLCLAILAMFFHYMLHYMLSPTLPTPHSTIHTPHSIPNTHTGIRTYTFNVLESHHLTFIPRSYLGWLIELALALPPVFFFFFSFSDLKGNGRSYTAQLPLSLSHILMFYHLPLFIIFSPFSSSCFPLPSPPHPFLPLPPSIW